ncbi:hypothetical protein OnM2_009021 [Erysiphe neolycopersici]|uniref:Uncharacterized protein n=1 Tax=Erysiphe neolycopersici TaxID=212602 RepID=A0A420I6T1_9PEZI|nr:hypothetical protein OnM2_009021 [Erysiphe neolycopersici]
MPSFLIPFQYLVRGIRMRPIKLAYKVVSGLIKKIDIRSLFGTWATEWFRSTEAIIFKINFGSKTLIKNNI